MAYIGAVVDLTSNDRKSVPLLSDRSNDKGGAGEHLLEKLGWKYPKQLEDLTSEGGSQCFLKNCMNHTEALFWNALGRVIPGRYSGGQKGM